MSDLFDIIEVFAECDRSDRLELLIDFGRRLPALDPEHSELRDAGMYLVHECQAPVFLKADRVNERVKIVADVPAEAPIARGFVGLLVVAFDGMPITEFSTAPDDLLAALGLNELVGMQRTRGLSAIYRRLKDAIAE